MPPGKARRFSLITISRRAYAKGEGFRVRGKPSPSDHYASFVRNYRKVLRASNPPPTSRAPAPKPRSEAVPLPPVFGSSFGASALAGAGAGLGAAGGALGGGGGVAFGGGGGAGDGGAGAGDGGGGAGDGDGVMLPSLWTAVWISTWPVSSVSCPNPSSTCATAGAAAASAAASMATNSINFLNVFYLLRHETRRRSGILSPTTFVNNPNVVFPRTS
jgi:hypothetical protein